MSDGTHLSYLDGDKIQWAGYMPIPNQSSKICLMPSMHSVVMVALLPIALMNRNNPQNVRDEQRRSN
jgi:hypothetical protein